MKYSIILEDYSFSNCELIKRFKTFDAFNSNNNTMILVSNSQYGDSDIANSLKSVTMPTVLIPHECKYAITE